MPTLVSRDVKVLTAGGPWLRKQRTLPYTSHLNNCFPKLHQTNNLKVLLRTLQTEPQTEGSEWKNRHVPTPRAKMSRRDHSHSSTCCWRNGRTTCFVHWLRCFAWRCGVVVIVVVSSSATTAPLEGVVCTATFTCILCTLQELKW